MNDNDSSILLFLYLILLIVDYYRAIIELELICFQTEVCFIQI